MRFKIYEDETLKTGLRFKLVFKKEGYIKKISITEEDTFTIEPIFYQFFSKYKNYGHWGMHIVKKDDKNNFENTFKEYIKKLEENKEKEFYVNLTDNNFGKAYNDINNNRILVIDFAKRLLEEINNEKDCEIEIRGI